MRPQLILLLLVPLVFCSLECPERYTLINGNKCVRVIRNHDTTKHGEAERDCRISGGTLVNVKNAIENRAISNLAASASASTAWLGLYCFADSSSNCYWDDASGTASNYSNFAPGHPQTSQGGCVFLSTATGQWTSGKCEVAGMPFVCEVPPTFNDTCDYNFNGYCYFPSIYEKVTNCTYPNAEAYCQSIGASLASIHSKMEHDFIKNIYTDRVGDQVFLGGKALQQDEFRWGDGTSWDFDYQDPMDKTKANCLVMDPHGIGLWKQVSCQTSNYFLCKRRAGGGSSGEAKRPQNKTPVLMKRLDTPNCNSTFLLAPGTLSSANSTYCSFALKTLGPYRIAIYLTGNYTFSRNIYVLDEYNRAIIPSVDNKSVISPSNIATLIFSATKGQETSADFETSFLEVTVSEL